MTKIKALMSVENTVHADHSQLFILFDAGQERIVQMAAAAVGTNFRVATSTEDANSCLHDAVVGLKNDILKVDELHRAPGRIFISTYCTDRQHLRNPCLSDFCDYEYVQSSKHVSTRDFARFLSFVLGERRPHMLLMQKSDTTMFPMSLQSVQIDLPDLDIVTVGADAIQLQVDLSEDVLTSNPAQVIEDVGQKLSALRRHCALPVVFSPKCTSSTDPQTFFKYLRKAVQWACEYIEVDTSLPLDLRRKLADGKGHSKIISVWHDWSGQFRWSSSQAHQIFQQTAKHGDIVKMVAHAADSERGLELDSFRALMRKSYPEIQFSGLNFGPNDTLLNTSNRVLTPVKHLLPRLSGAQERSGTAEVNVVRHNGTPISPPEFVTVGNELSSEIARFFEKLINELGQPGRIGHLDRLVCPSIGSMTKDEHCHSMFFNPPVAISGIVPCPWNISEAASMIGMIDVVIAAGRRMGQTMVADNVTWKGIQSTLTQDCTSSAYAGKTAIVIASSQEQAAAAIYALLSLDIGPIYTIGFKARGRLASGIRQCHGLADLDMTNDPFVVISALSADRSQTALPVLMYDCTPSRHATRLFVNLSASVGPTAACKLSTFGWTSYGMADVNAHTLSAAAEHLFGSFVTADFVKLVAGGILCP